MKIDSRTMNALVKEASKFGFELTFNSDMFDQANRDRYHVIEVYEKGQDSEPAGIIVTDFQTYQWRKVYRGESGMAGQGLNGFKQLIAKV